MKLGFLFITLAIVAANVYVLWHVYHVLTFPTWAKWTIVALMVAALAMLITGLFGAYNRMPLWLASAAYDLSTSWLIVFLYLLIDHADQIRSSGEEFAALALLSRGDCIGDTVRFRIRKVLDHFCASFIAFSARPSRIFRGDSGLDGTRTPMALWTALAIAVDAPVGVLSARPQAPYSLAPFQVSFRIGLT